MEFRPDSWDVWGIGMDKKIVKQRLLALRAELEALNQLSNESRSPVTLDQSSVGRLSRMDAMQQQAMAMATLKRRQNDLVRITQALERLESDEYGYCDECGEDILPQRLEVDPLATRCTRCASR